MYVHRTRSVQHVGTLDLHDLRRHGARGGHSHEGHHLSVSSHPEAWRQIARLGTLPTHTLHRTGGGQFLDLHRAEAHEAFLGRVLAWGTEAGLITSGVRWAAWEQDDDHDWRFTLHLTAVAAAHEAADQLLETTAPHHQPALEQLLDELRDRPSEDVVTRLNRLAVRPFVTSEPCPLPTEALQRTTGIHRPDDATTALLIAWAQQHPAPDGRPYDGVWWHDRLDVHRHSAPRGLIYRERLLLWSARPHSS